MTFPPRATGLSTAATLAFVVLLAWPAQAGPARQLHGQLGFDRATLAGDTTLSLQPTAIHLVADGRAPIDAAWTLHASRVLVNWSRLSGIGAGTDPSDPDKSFASSSPQESFGESTYLDAQLASTFAAVSSSWLLVPTRADFDANASTPVEVQSSAPDQWTSGMYSNESKGQRPLTVDYQVPSGEAVFRGRGPLTGTVHGDFILYVWQGPVQVDAGNHSATYRSGTWFDNATVTQLGARGVTRSQYAQLVRLEVTDGTLHVDHRRGVAEWVGADATTRTAGTATLEAAQGVLESAAGAYTFTGQAAVLSGTVSQRITSAAPEESHPLKAVISADADPTGFSSRAPAPSGVPAAHAWIWPVVVTGILLAAGLIWWVRRRQPAKDYAALIHDAQEALATRRPKVARRYARQILRNDPNDLEGWFVRAASLQLDHRHQELVRDVGPVVERLGGPPILAFVVAVSSMVLGRVEETVRWIEAASREPSVRATLRAHPAFDSLRQDPRVVRLLAVDESGSAYA